MDFKISVEFVNRDGVVKFHSVAEQGGEHQQIESEELRGDGRDAARAQQFMQHVSDAILNRFEPSLSQAYTAVDSAIGKKVMIDIPTHDARKIEWAGKLKKLQEEKN